MRRLLFLMLLPLLLLAGCDKEPNGDGNQDSKAIVGVWELVDIRYTKSAQLGDYVMDVVIDFRSDGRFVMSQKLGQGRPREHSGTWTLDSGVLSGKYADGSVWGASYTVLIEGSRLSMTPVGKSSPEVFVYSRK